ncbi:ABC transporter permease [Cellulosimicrobium cellulans]|uniref:ABC transporter permease n=1 Tax=Cellulosimicrobium cellulans TaxID=1710 RepID=UPI00130E7521|nr:ABC transporter permease [Cellulosimicrobium cellulans]
MTAIVTFARTQLRAFSRDPVAMFFTVLLPLVFLAVFGTIFGDTSTNFRVAVIDSSGSEFTTAFVDRAEDDGLFQVVDVDSLDEAKEQMGRGQIDSIVELPEGFGQVGPVGDAQLPTGQMTVYYEESSPQSGQTVAAVMQSMLDAINREMTGFVDPLTVEQQPTSTAGLSQFDYTFAGMVAFSMLSLGLFGLANIMPAVKRQGVLRRIRSTPFQAPSLLLGTALQYLVIGLISLTVMMIAGLTIFSFDMRGSWLTLLAFAVPSLLMMIGFGLLVGAWAKNENQAAPLSNLIALPLMFLSGIFFPRFLMPGWLQDATAWLPLTPVADGIRFITTEGASLMTVAPQLAVVLGWTVLVYLLAFRLFRWE